MKKTYLFLIVNLLTASIIAQGNGPKRTFAEYTSYLAKEFNITCKLPKHFSDLNSVELWKAWQDHNSGAGMVFSPILQSDNQECILMYQMIIWNVESENEKKFSKMVQAVNKSMSRDKSKFKFQELTNEQAARNNMIFQLRTALGQSDTYGNIIKDSVFNFNKYVKVYSGEKVKKSFNADSIFIIDIPLQKAYKEKYINCTAMFLTKKHQPSIEFLWYFTKEDEQNKNKYFKMLNKKIWYN